MGFCQTRGMTSEERMKAWEGLPKPTDPSDTPKPTWETFKRLLAQFGTVEKAMACWADVCEKQKRTGNLQ